MSEPWATVVAHTNYVKGKITHQGSDYEKIIQACIRLQCKPEINKKVERILAYKGGIFIILRPLKMELFVSKEQ